MTEIRHFSLQANKELFLLKYKILPQCVITFIQVMVRDKGQAC